jgi:hypothetical protein
MNMRHWLWQVVLLIGLALAACNGSGSSGFDGPHRPGDVGPTLEEEMEEVAVLMQVLSTQTCADHQTLAVCPAESVDIFGMAPSIMTDLLLQAPLTCRLNRQGTRCRVRLRFITEGFPAEAVFGVAVRPTDRSVPWVVGPLAVAIGTPETSQLEASALLALPPTALRTNFAAAAQSADGARQDPVSLTVHLAILVWLTPPALREQTFALLTDSDPAWVFVEERLVHVEP